MIDSFDADNPPRELLPTAREIFLRSGRIWPKRPVAILGTSPVMANLLSRVKKFAKFAEPVLIRGESGTGKELIARAIYLMSSAIDNKFVAVNCPQHTDTDMTASELFGHKKGSFTGAVTDRIGLFETAEDGLVFLDEIADLPLKTQVMLLRALAEGEFRRVGDSEARVVNTRVAAATNRSLQDLVVRNEFRHDLLFRLSFFPIVVPPLRERGDDWRLISAGFLSNLEKEYGIRRRFSEDSLKMLSNYHWPGNVRQLHAVVALGYSTCEGDLIEPTHFETALEWQTEFFATGQGERVDGNGSRLLETGPGGSPQPDQTVPSGQPTEAEMRALFESLKCGHESFWKLVHGPFLDRELNRSQVRLLIDLGLAESSGSYKRLMELFHMSNDEYQKFMGFLKTHRLKNRRGK